jgi:hypothetical protein
MSMTSEKQELTRKKIRWSLKSSLVLGRILISDLCGIPELCLHCFIRDHSLGPPEGDRILILLTGLSSIGKYIGNIYSG